MHRGDAPAVFCAAIKKKEKEKRRGGGKKKRGANFIGCRSARARARGAAGVLHAYTYYNVYLSIKIIKKREEKDLRVGRAGREAAAAAVSQN